MKQRHPSFFKVCFVKVSWKMRGKSKQKYFHEVTLLALSSTVQ